jgi:hypothetical protein
MLLWEKVRSFLYLIWELLIRFIKWSYKPIGLFLVLVSVWYGFLKLVKTPPLDTTPVLIMVWVTAAVLLLSLFPSVLNNIKKVKIGDFELELQDTVKSAVAQDFISVTDLEDSGFMPNQKGDASSLRNTIINTLRSPEKPVLLIVNLRQRISRAFLFVYLYVIDFFSTQTIVLFINKDRNDWSLSNLLASDVIGAVPGKKLLREYYIRFPALLNNLGRGVDVNRILEPMGLLQIPTNQFIERLYRQTRQNVSLENDENRIALQGLTDIEGDRLTVNEIERWLTNTLDKTIVDISLEKTDVDKIYQSLLRNAELLLIADGKKLKTVLLVCSFSRNVSKKVLSKLSDIGKN